MYINDDSDNDVHVAVIINAATFHIKLQNAKPSMHFRHCSNNTNENINTNH